MDNMDTRSGTHRPSPMERERMIGGMDGEKELRRHLKMPSFLYSICSGLSMSAADHTRSRTSATRNVCSGQNLPIFRSEAESGRRKADLTVRLSPCPPIRRVYHFIYHMERASTGGSKIAFRA